MGTKSNITTNWEAVARGIALGDTGAFRQCFDVLHQDIYRYAFAYLRSRELAEDIVQDVFAKLWAHRYTVDSSQHLRAYVYQIARNTIFNQLKRATYDQRMRDTVFFRQQTQHNEVEEGYFHEELNGLYLEAVAKLPPQRQLVFTLSRNEGMTHDEIAQQLTISRNTVKDQIVKASHFIRHYINANMKEHTVYSPILPIILGLWLK